MKEDEPVAQPFPAGRNRAIIPTNKGGAPMRFRRPAQPDVLSAAAGRLTEETARAWRQKRSRGPELDPVLHHPEILDSLLRMTNGTCAYCERALEAQSPDAAVVAHHRPTWGAVGTEGDGDVVQRHLREIAGGVGLPDLSEFEHARLSLSLQQVSHPRTSRREAGACPESKPLPEQSPPTKSRGLVVEGSYLGLSGNVEAGPFDNALARTSRSAAQGTGGALGAAQ